MIQVKKIDLYRIADGLKKIMPKTHKSTGYWLQKIADKVEIKSREFEKDRENLMKQYSEKDADGKPICKRQENGVVRYTNLMPEYYEKLEELGNELIEFNMKQIPVEKFDEDAIKKDNLTDSMEQGSIREFIKLPAEFDEEI